MKQDPWWQWAVVLVGLALMVVGVGWALVTKFGGCREPVTGDPRIIQQTGVCHDTMQSQLLLGDVVVCPHPEQQAEVVCRPTSGGGAVLLCKCRRNP